MHELQHDKKFIIFSQMGSVVLCFKSLIANQLRLRQLANKDGEVVQKAVNKQESKKILHEAFLDKTEGTHKLLAPIARVLIALETKETPDSDLAGYQGTRYLAF